MEERGIGKTADVLFLALMVSLSSFLLLGANTSSNFNESPSFSERVAQNTLLSLSRVSLKEFGTFSYNPDIPIRTSSERILREKTPLQLIAEGLILDPDWTLEDSPVEESINVGFTEELLNFLKLSFDDLVGRRFGYRFSIQIDPVEVPEIGILHYRRVVEDFDRESEKLCSERIFLNVVFPQAWFEGPSVFECGEKSVNMKLTLELWSR